MNNKYYAAGPPPKQHAVPTQAGRAPSFDTYSDFVNYITGRHCPGCNTAFFHSSKDIEALFQSWLNKTPISCQIQCKRCSKSTCIACFGRSGTPTERNAGSFKMSWCCSRGRLFLVWIMLCGFDQVYCDRQRREASTSGQTKTLSAGSGVGYTGGFPDGIFMFSRRQMGISEPRDGKKEQAESAERKSDRFDEAIFSSLAGLCPSPHHDRDKSSFDVNPPRAVTSMLVHSKILDRAAELLRNDSLDNATQRKDLYMAMISFLKRVGVHGISKDDVIFNARIVLPNNENLLTLSFKGPPPRTTEIASSLSDGLRRLSVQSNTMMRGALNNRHEFQDTRGQDMLWLCREISDLSAHLRIEEWSAQHSDDPVGNSCFVVEVPDKDLWARYHFAQQAQMLQHSPPGRIGRLITEITTLKTGLSEGIFVKHAMSRLDCMSILIIGPEGTPYENGLYEFDLFCGAKFPNKPPVMVFRYPTACPQSINPNLHRHDGKVCLSLLGTWLSGAEGEDWQPGRSTILQVLISVQAMIFCEDPMGNEPGLGAHLSDQRSFSNSLNRMVRGHTVKCNLLHYAQHVPTLWKEVVEKHFRANGDKMLKVIERWAKEHSEPIGTSHDMQVMSASRVYSPLMSVQMNGITIDMGQMLPMLRAALAKYGATYVPKQVAATNRGQTPSSYGNSFGGRGGFHGPGYGSGYGGRNSRYG